MSICSNSFITLCLSFTILTGCSTTERKEIPIHSVEDILDNISSTNEIFEIDPNEENLLTGKKGTTIYIPADAFQLEDGSILSGNVQIELRECFTLSEMIALNKSTTSEEHLLETGGMVYFNATVDGKPVSFQEGKAYVVGFPKNGNTEEMDLFYDFTFNDTFSTWIPDYRLNEAEATKSIAVNSSFLTDSSVINYPVKLTEDLFDNQLFVSSSIGNFDYNIARLKDYLENPSTVDENTLNKLFENNTRIKCWFGIDNNGRIKNLKINPKEHISANSVEIISKIFQNAPLINLKSEEIEICDTCIYYLGLVKAQYLNYTRYKKRFREQYEEYTNKAIQKLNKSELDLYLFSVTEMGWINCDRFFEIDELDKTNFIVTTPKPNSTNIQIIFQDINGILAGNKSHGQFVFNSLPIGMKIKIIGISYSNGKPMLALAETQIGKDIYELSTFKEFTLNELENKLNGLKQNK